MVDATGSEIRVWANRLFSGYVHFGVFDGEEDIPDGDLSKSVE